ncbi:MAG: hypothetical protein AzoDbin1_03037 [Azoarcus sp.]|nr:hypothetical protein [Azoarcus sp.]
MSRLFAKASRVCLAVAAATSLSSLAASPAQDGASRPNILLVVVDDLGFNDLGATGGEIATPNLDALAQSSVLMTDFHAAPTCSLTRSMLMTGADNHQAGLGTMAERPKAPNQRDQPGYQGRLDERLATIAERLQGRGYATFMAGKWHLGSRPEDDPSRKGFEDSFTMLQGGASHFADRLGITPGAPQSQWRDNGREVTQLPENFFSSTAITDRALAAIDRHRSDARPFFGYVAYTAPHWPLQVPEEWLDRYRGRYDAGYEALWRERHERMKRLGFIPADATLPPFPSYLRKWDELTPEQRRVAARSMELYAAMVEQMDQQIGRLFAGMKAAGKYDDTLIVFLSDNGADSENVRAIWARAGEDKAREFEAKFDFSLENMGRPRSFVSVADGWAPARTLPARLYKGMTTEGGVRVPAIIKYPGRDGLTGRTRAFASVLDLPPTFLELAGEAQREQPRPGRVVPEQLGRSMVGLLTRSTPRVHGDDYAMGWELWPNKALRKGDWKLVRLGPPHKTADWQLFDLSKDPAEAKDLAVAESEKLREMISAYDQYAARVGVIEPEWEIPPAPRAAGGAN